MPLNDKQDKLINGLPLAKHRGFSVLAVFNIGMDNHILPVVYLRV